MNIENLNQQLEDKDYDKEATINQKEKEIIFLNEKINQKEKDLEQNKIDIKDNISKYEQEINEIKEENNNLFK